ncbi:E3 SUMO-protein ligase NSE2 [Stomoxys calcitrans]|uniref:E3 SUMO-protein ligase NSE2 n=1 Tax=Stomoxys calcitrans TaxID=35570 RepID=UPI0027E25309|nr:E3 SUMO-protein ligase NSE2 [Stomoxys calcitrans]
MNVQLKTDLENARQCLLETYHLALTYGDPETHNTEKYLELAAKLSQINETAKRHDEALEAAKESRTIDDFAKEYNNQVSKLEAKKYNPKNSSEYKSFRDQITQMQSLQDGDAGRVECDEFVMESEINVFDPLTKQRMKNPVRNTQCGHHYEKSHILEAIQINKRLRCPVAGCGNKNFVEQKHLKDDNLFKVRLQKIAEQEAAEED